MNYKIATCWSVLAGVFRPLCVLKAPVLQVDSFQIAREDWGWECAWEGIMESLSRVASDALGKLLQLGGLSPPPSPEKAVAEGG